MDDISMDRDSLYINEEKIISEVNDKAFIFYYPLDTKYDEYIKPLMWDLYLGKKIANKFYNQIISLNDIIQIPDNIFTGNLLVTGKIDEFEKQHKADFDFHYFKHSINISEIHNDKIKIETVNINCEFNHLNTQSDRPIVLSYFPKTSFVDLNFHGNFKLYFNGGAGIKADYELRNKYYEMSADAKQQLKNEADFIYEYTPKIANISAYGNGSQINYTFNRAAKSKDMPYPTGALEIYGIFMRPRSVKDVYLRTKVTINNHDIPIQGLTKLVLSKS